MTVFWLNLNHLTPQPQSLNPSFLLFWLSFDCFWRLVHCRYRLGRHVTIGTPMVIFAVLTVFWLFFTIGILLVHRWYSLGRPVTISTPMVIFSVCFWLFLTIGTLLVQSKQQKRPLVYQSLQVYQDCTNSVPVVKNCQKTVKTAKKMTIGVPIVTGLPKLYQQCKTVYQSSKTVKRQSKQQKWPLVYQ